MLGDLPVDLWAEGWKLVPGDTRILHERGGGYHIAVYVRPFDRLRDVPHPTPGYVMRRTEIPAMRVSTYAACCQSWGVAHTSAIDRMRTGDGQRLPIT